MLLVVAVDPAGVLERQVEEQVEQVSVQMQEALK